jgi:hypothetical protein
VPYETEAPVTECAMFAGASLNVLRLIAHPHSFRF